MTTYATNRTAKLYASPLVILDPSGVTFKFGPTDSMPADSVLITREKLATVGADAIRVGDASAFVINLFTTQSGVETALDLSTGYTNASIALSVWDPVSKAANTEWTVVLQDPTTAGMIMYPDNATFAPSTAGMFQWVITITSDDIVGSAYTDLCGGWLEVKGQYE